MPLRAECFRRVHSQCSHLSYILENTPHEEVFRGCTIIGIFFDSCVAYARQANRHEMLFERSEFIE